MSGQVNGTIANVHDGLRQSIEVCSSKSKLIKQQRLKQLKSSNELVIREKKLKEYASLLLKKQNELTEKKKSLIKNNNLQIQKYKTEKTTLTHKLEMFDATIQSNNETLNLYDRDKEVQSNNIKELNSKIEEITQKGNILTTKITKARASNFDQQIRQGNIQIDDMQKKISDLEKAIIEKEGVKAKMMRNSMEIRKKISDLLRRQNELQQEISLSNEKRIRSAEEIKESVMSVPFNGVQKAKNAIDDEINSIQARITEKISKINELSNEELQIEIKKKKLNISIQSINGEITDSKNLLVSLNIKSNYSCAMESESSVASKRLSLLNKEKEKTEKDITSINKEIEKVEQEIEQTNKRFADDKLSFDELVEIYDKMEKAIEEENTINDENESAKLEQQKLNIKSIEEEKRKILEASIKLQQEMQAEYQNEAVSQTKLYTEVTALETQKRFKEIELSSLIKKIKQCLKLPPDLVAVLSSSKNRFRNSNDIAKEIKNRSLIREERNRKLSDEINMISSEIMDKENSIDQIDERIHSSDEDFLVKKLFVEYLSLLTDNFSYESFNKIVDEMFVRFSLLGI